MDLLKSRVLFGFEVIDQQGGVCQTCRDGMFDTILCKIV